MKQEEKPGEVECPACDGIGKTCDRGWPLRGQPFFDTKPCDVCKGTGRQPAAPAESAWKYAGINLNPEHFETFAPEETSTHERRGLDGAAIAGVDPGVGGERRTGDVPIEELIERSSLGTPEAKAMRTNTPRSVVNTVLKRADEISENAPAEGEREYETEYDRLKAQKDAILKREYLHAQAELHEQLYQEQQRSRRLESALAASKARAAEVQELRDHYEAKSREYYDDASRLTVELSAEKARVGELSQRVAELLHIGDSLVRLSEPAMSENDSWCDAVEQWSLATHPLPGLNDPAPAEKLSAAQAENARLRELIAHALTYVAESPRTAAPTVADRIRSALAASEATPKPKGGE